MPGTLSDAPGAESVQSWVSVLAGTSVPSVRDKIKPGHRWVDSCEVDLN